MGVAQTGDYIIEVTDNNTCVGKDTMSVYFQTAPQLVYTDVPAFSGGSFTGTYASNGEYIGSHNGHEYYMVQSSVSWTAAKSAAEGLGGYLAIPNDAQENQAIIDMANSQNVWGSDAWIGVEWTGNKWIDVKGNDLLYSNWWNSTSAVSYTHLTLPTTPYV